MKHNQNKRVFMGLYAATASMMLLTGFTSLAAEKETDPEAVRTAAVQEETVEWAFSDIVAGVQGEALKETKSAAEAAPGCIPAEGGRRETGCRGRRQDLRRSGGGC